MSSPKIAGPPKHVGPKVADVEAHTKAGTNIVTKDAVIDPFKTVAGKIAEDAAQKLPVAGPDPLKPKPEGEAGKIAVDASKKLQEANQLKPVGVAGPKDTNNRSKTTNTTTHTTNTTKTATPDTPTPNINIINPEPKTTLSEKPAGNIVKEAHKIAELANALNPNKNKNELNKLKTNTNYEKTKQNALKQQLRNTKKEKAKTRNAERKKTFITNEIQTLEGKISKGKKQSKRSISIHGTYANQIKRLREVQDTDLTKLQTATSSSLTEQKVVSTAPTEPTEPKAEPTAEPTAPKAELPTEPTATKAEPTAPKPEPTADQVVSSAPTTPKVEEPKTANTASNVIKTNSAEAESTKTFNNYLTKRLQLPNNTKTKNTKTKKYNTNSEEYQRLLIHDPPAAEIFKEKAKAESKAELEKQVNNSISNIGKLFEETPSNSQKKTKAESNAPKVSNFNNYLTKRLQLPNNTKTKNTKTKKNKLLINTSDAAIERSSISLIHKIDAEQDKAWNVIKEKYRIAGIDVRGDDHAAEKARSEIVKLGVQFEREKQTRIDTHLKTLYNLRTQERLKSYLDKSIKRKEIVNESIGNIGKLFEEPPSNSQKKTKAAEHSAELFKHNNKNSSKAIITNGAPAINILNTKKTQTHENTNTAGEYIEINKFNFNDEIPKNTTNIQNQN